MGGTHFSQNFHRIPKPPPPHKNFTKPPWHSAPRLTKRGRCASRPRLALVHIT
nr:MAG TPA: hypothetical protein [Caudoviricetes sp.]